MVKLLNMIALTHLLSNYLYIYIYIIYNPMRNGRIWYHFVDDGMGYQRLRIFVSSITFTDKMILSTKGHNFMEVTT